MRDGRRRAAGGGRRARRVAGPSSGSSRKRRRNSLWSSSSASAKRSRSSDSLAVRDEAERAVGELLGGARSTRVADAAAARRGRRRGTAASRRPRAAPSARASTGRAGRTTTSTIENPKDFLRMAPLRSGGVGEGMRTTWDAAAASDRVERLRRRPRDGESGARLALLPARRRPARRHVRRGRLRLRADDRRCSPSASTAWSPSTSRRRCSSARRRPCRRRTSSFRARRRQRASTRSRTASPTCSSATSSCSTCPAARSSRPT